MTANPPESSQLTAEEESAELDLLENESTEQDRKRTKLETATNEEQNEHSNQTAVAEAPLTQDPRTSLIDTLAKEYNAENDEFEVVIGPNVGQTARRGVDSLPAFRYSSNAKPPTLQLEITPEQEEALRVTGVNASNYSEKLNPGHAQKRKNALEDNLDEIENPKWRDPNAVPSDYFNYGLNEQTWKEYAARQVALRLYRLQKMQSHSGEE